MKISAVIILTALIKLMKKNFLLIFVILLFLAIILLSYFKFFTFSKESSIDNKSNNLSDDVKSSNVTNTDTFSDILYWNSYLRETFDDDNKIIDSSNNNNYYLEMDNFTIRICTRKPSNCDEVNYEKNGSKYIINTSNEKFLKANLSIVDDVSSDFGSIIKIIKTYDDEEGGYSIFYFKKSDEESVK